MKKYAIYILTGLRILVGWHFLYEGIAKLVAPGWSAKLFLMGTNRIFFDVFHKMADSPGLMQTVGFLQRREGLRDLISLPVPGTFAYALYKKQRWVSSENKFMLEKADALSGATIKTFTFSSLGDLKGQIPKGKIRKMEISRLIIGGNLIGGWSHARNLERQITVDNGFNNEYHQMQMNCRAHRTDNGTPGI